MKPRNAPPGGPLMVTRRLMALPRFKLRVTGPRPRRGAGPGKCQAGAGTIMIMVWCQRAPPPAFASAQPEHGKPPGRARYSPDGERQTSGQRQRQRRIRRDHTRRQLEGQDCHSVTPGWLPVTAAPICHRGSTPADCRPALAALLQHRLGPRRSDDKCEDTTWMLHAPKRCNCPH